MDISKRVGGDREGMVCVDVDVHRPTGRRVEDVDVVVCSGKVTHGQQHSVVQQIGGDVCFLVEILTISFHCTF